MKKYKRTLPLVSYKKGLITALLMSVVSFILCFLFGINNYTMICFSLTIALWTIVIVVFFPSGYKYSLSESYIKLYYFSVFYRRVFYSKYGFAIISNASYNNSYGSGPYGNISIKYDSVGTSNTTSTIYPYTTLHESGYPINKTKSGMSSRDLYMIDSENTLCLGICWFDSLAELVDYSMLSVYILEDIYLRYRGMFDSLFAQNKSDTGRFFIIADRIVEYSSYKQKDRGRLA